MRGRSPAGSLSPVRCLRVGLSHCMMDSFSLLSIFSFMHTQYLRITASAAPPLLSLMHSSIHLTSSALRSAQGPHDLPRPKQWTPTRPGPTHRRSPKCGPPATIDRWISVERSIADSAELLDGPTMRSELGRTSVEHGIAAADDRIADRPPHAQLRIVPQEHELPGAVVICRLLVMEYRAIGQHHMTSAELRRDEHLLPVDLRERETRPLAILRRRRIVSTNTRWISRSGTIRASRCSHGHEFRAAHRTWRPECPPRRSRP